MPANGVGGNPPSVLHSWQSPERRAAPFGGGANVHSHKKVLRSAAETDELLAEEGGTNIHSDACECPRRAPTR